MRTASFVGIALLLSLGCKSHQEREEAKKLTPGVVKREIRKGMSGAEVVEALGSPNIVTADENGNETWTYERYARDVETESDGYWAVFLYGSHVRSSGFTRTFTLVIRFNKESKVDWFAYHATTM